MTTTNSAAERAAPTPTEAASAPGTGVVPAQGLRVAIAKDWISADRRVTKTAVQPASVDLRLGETAWPLRCSFLPDTSSTVEEKLSDLAFPPVDLHRGAVLERDRPYLIPLQEELSLPQALRAKANPKSSTGRLDVFTRVITDNNHRFDEIRAGYRGKLYLEVVPRSFAIWVEEGLSLNQLRLIAGDERLSDRELLPLHHATPLLWLEDEPLTDEQLAIADGLFLGVDLSGGPDQIVGYRAKRTSLPIDMARVRSYKWTEYWEPVLPEAGDRVVLDPEVFYLLLSKEGICIPPTYAAEMMAYDPTAGELRTHYAGFFDPGFGWDPDGAQYGSRAALEVRARDVPFMVEHGQPICKLAFERMVEIPAALYGEDLGSNYQGQVSMLSKHFVEQTAGIVQMHMRAAGTGGTRPPVTPTSGPSAASNGDTTEHVGALWEESIAPSND